MSGRSLAVVVASALALSFGTAAADASAPRVFLTGANNQVTSSFDVDPATGAMTAIAGSPFAGGGNALALNPAGSHLYAAGNGAQTFVYDVAANGVLSQIAGSPFAGGGTEGIAVAPDGGHVYATRYLGSTLSAYSVDADGALTALSGSPFSVPGGPAAIAVSPDGSHLYVARYNTGDLLTYAIGSDGIPTLQGTSTGVAEGVNGLSITPDGLFLYVPSFESGSTYGFAIAADGSLSPVPGSPIPGLTPVGTAIDPSGEHLFVTQFNAVRPYTIGADGSLTAGTDIAASSARSLAVSPDGKLLYVGSGRELVYAFAIAADGSLSTLPGSTSQNGQGAGDEQAIAAAPAQGPSAAFTVAAANAQSPTAFDATATSASADRFDWDFGDGTTLPDGGPTPTHTYAAEGVYDVSLSTSDQGCSTGFSYTGQTVSCNGSEEAEITRQVSVGAPLPTPSPPSPPSPPDDEPPVITELRVTPRSFTADSADTPADTLARILGAGVEFTVSEDARLRFHIRHDPPKRTGGPAPKRLRVFKRNVKGGANTVAFTGTLGGDTFKPGPYVVIAVARDGKNQRSDRRSAPFRIVGP